MRNLDLVAHIAGTLLAGRADAEPHHIRQAVDTARAIVDETWREDDEEPVASAPEAAEDVPPAATATPPTEPGGQPQ